VTEPAGERRPRPPRRRRRWLRRLLVAVVVIAAFAVGVAVGEALHDNPKPGVTITTIRTIRP
jgi:ferric-dicitrate binding protein FerR (iron transport regulator)